MLPRDDPAGESGRLESPDGRVGHAEVKIGDSTTMLADEFPEMGIAGPESVGG
jgi:PhnB protein